METLFDAPVGAVNVAGVPAVSSSAYGKMAEQLAIVELLRRGYRVAVPVVDDAGVDLVVDYRVTVQVKTASRTLLRVGGYGYSGFTWSNNSGRFSADVFVLHAFEGERSRWWVVPTEVFRRHGTKSSINFRSGVRGLGAELALFEDGWDVFGG